MQGYGSCHWTTWTIRQDATWAVHHQAQDFSHYYQAGPPSPHLDDSPPASLLCCVRSVRVEIANLFCTTGYCARTPITHRLLIEDVVLLFHDGGVQIRSKATFRYPPRLLVFYQADCVVSICTYQGLK